MGADSPNATRSCPQLGQAPRVTEQPHRAPSTPGFSPKLKPLQGGELSGTPGRAQLGSSCSSGARLWVQMERRGNLTIVLVPPHPGTTTVPMRPPAPPASPGEGEPCGMLHRFSRAPAQQNQTHAGQGTPKPSPSSRSRRAGVPAHSWQRVQPLWATALQISSRSFSHPYKRRL